MKVTLIISVIGYNFSLSKFKEKVSNKFWLYGFVCTGELYKSVDALFNKEPYLYSATFTAYHYNPKKADINSLLLYALDLAEELDLVVTDMAH